jgi:MscS family membrane protein
MVAKYITVTERELSSWALFFVIILISLVAGKLARIFLSKLSEKANTADKKQLFSVILSSLANPIMLIAFAVGLRIALVFMDLSPKLLTFLTTMTGMFNSFAIGYLIYSMVDVVDYYLSKWTERTESKVDDALAPLVGKAVRITVLVLVVLNVVVRVSGQDITTIVASLGVGGLAFALAGQDTIKNFFGSIVIFGDKPFEIGDRIVVDGHDGPVETVGFRSTKIRTLDGHLVTVPNSEMVNKTVRNIGKRPYIKRVANISITYDTAPAKVERAIEIIKEILNDHEGMDPDYPPRVYFNDFLDSSLNIVMIYWYHPPEYWDYMAFSECVNMQILNRFNDEGIEFAFPTQTLYIQK